MWQEKEREGGRGVEIDVRVQMGPELADLCEDFGFCSELDLSLLQGFDRVTSVTWVLWIPRL